MAETFIYLKDGRYYQVTEESPQAPLQHRALSAWELSDLSSAEVELIDQQRGDDFEYRLETFRGAISPTNMSYQQYNPRAPVRSGSQLPSDTTPLSQPEPAAPTTSASTPGGGISGTNNIPIGAATTQTNTNANTETASTNGGDNFRVRLSHLPGASNKYPGILKPLEDTRGLLFPYTPTIAFSQEVDYDTMALVHSNSNFISYARSPNVNISLTAKFTVQNYAEGKYALAAIHFMRSVSKMYFGEKDAQEGLAGIPPPVLLLDGYGAYMFNKVRVVVRSHSWTFDENMHTVPITIDGTTVRLPPLFTMSISLTVQQTARAHRKDFKLDEFKNGNLLKSSGGWI